MSKKVRLSVPGAGRTIASATEERAQHVRRAVQYIEPCFRSRRAELDFLSIFTPRWTGGHLKPAVESSSQRAAWALVNIYLLARCAGIKGTFTETEKWFLGSFALPSLATYVKDPDQALAALSRIHFDDDLLDLLPYVLEVHGPGSRISVMRDPRTRMAQQAKRKNGVFYTPADVAEYMVGEALEGRGFDIRCLDPSCGHGVFLIAILRLAAAHYTDGKHFDAFEFCVRSLYGLDISSLAVESCTFVLLHHCIQDALRRKTIPWAAWHTLRLNLAATDALPIKAVTGEPPVYSAAAKRRAQIRNRLLKGVHVEIIEDELPTNVGPQTRLFGEECLPPLGVIFPEAEAGFDVLAGNPPYATIGQRDDAPLVEADYACLKDGCVGADFYPAFIEMMWRLTKSQDSAASLVVPLSIGYHRGGQFEACRRAMANAGGRWRFAFFDRQPHALFGEDVKTRNAILFRSETPADPPRGTPARLETGPLTKWTSRTREKLFAGLSFTELIGVSIADGIPKLRGGEQSHAYSILSRLHDRLSTLCRRSRTTRPVEATQPADRPRLFVASTAYNFLNVFRSIAVEDDRHPLSENTVHCLEFDREEDAQMAFAILSSRLTYWLWHVEGDGFHVGAWFIQHLPFGRSTFSPDQAAALRACGRTLWDALQAHRIVSLNKGRQTIAYRPLALEKERDEIDELLIDGAGLPHRFKQTLKAFVKDAVVVDNSDARRSHLLSLFDAQEEDG